MQMSDIWYWASPPIINWKTLNRAEIQRWLPAIRSASSVVSTNQFLDLQLLKLAAIAENMELLLAIAGPGRSAGSWSEIRNASKTKAEKKRSESTNQGISGAYTQGSSNQGSANQGLVATAFVSTDLSSELDLDWINVSANLSYT